MRKCFNTVKGVCIPNLEGIKEGYNIIENTNYFQINVNVSAENIDSLFKKLCTKVRTPGFLLLEHGTNEELEKQIRKSDTDPFHKDIYYLDGLELKSFFDLYNQYKDLLVNDGEINYGFGSHIGTDELQR